MLSFAVFKVCRADLSGHDQKVQGELEGLDSLRTFQDEAGQARCGPRHSSEEPQILAEEKA